jgi:biopolymer transport protein ExbD
MKMPRRRRRPIAVPVVSMGDIAFLLTIFFMVCSNFAKEAGIKWTAAAAPDMRVLKESKISVSIDEEDVIRLQGQVVPDAASVEAGVTALMQRRTGPDAKMVMFKCDRGVDKAVFEPVIGALARAGATIVAVGEKSAAAP